jgi:cyclopropane-fatty-acyl-phospholipid synthase
VKSDAQQRLVQSMLDIAGVQIDGGRPFDIKVNDPRLYSAVLGNGTMGLGESYMDGWWDCPALDQFFERVLTAGLEKRMRRSKALLWAALKARMLDPQRLTKAFEIGEHHYDIGNDLFVKMLDKGLNYSCGYWESAVTLDQAQEAKLDLICRKLDVRNGMRVLDIGCGWGGFAMYAAEKYGAHVTGVSVSREQIDLARERAAGLPVDFELFDYRSISGSFDRIVSIGMFEHVGVSNYRTFMEVAHRSLADDGLMLLHTIGRNRSGRIADPWIAKYIFPNSMNPSAKQITTAAEGLFVLEDWHNFGVNYDPTLMAWYKNFEDSWDSIKHDYDERFYRMWTYYLLSCAASFRVRRNQVWQVVLSPRGVRGGYRSVR